MLSHIKKNIAARTFIYFWRYLKNPAKATEDISGEKNKLAIGCLFLLYFGIGYSIVAITVYFLGALPDSPFISLIPAKKWYLVQAITTIPLTFISHGIYSTTAYLLSRLMKGNGSFDATFSSQAFTVYIPALIFMWLPELTLFTYLNSKGIYSYPWPDFVEYLRVFILPFIWIITISTISLMKVHRFSWWKAAISVIISLILSGGISAFFIR
ncbi:MAG: hypothetical protein FJW69_01535 [Actinobacteria bacterium]|nr:hypothetical protein [Actinomycetota bacterium]